MDEELEQNNNKLNPDQVEEKYKDVEIKKESDKEDCEKYTWFGASVKHELNKVKENFEEDPLGTVLSMSPDPITTLPLKISNDLTKRIGENIKEKQEKEKAEEEKAGDEQKKAEEDEKNRLEELKSTYIVNSALIQCSYSPNRSYLITPTSHGQFIKNIPQLNTKDNRPDSNIVSFKVCCSPLNPSVKEAAKEVLEKAQDRSKSFLDRFMDLFAKPKEIDINNIDEGLLKGCAGDCLYCTGNLEWIDGEETVTVDNSNSLLGRCRLMCIYGGEITFYTSGQEPK